MLDTLRRQLNPATVIALIALVFATTGGAYAVTSHGGGATGAKALASKRKHKSAGGARGPAGPRGATGPAGSAGPTGSAGPQGPAGANGKDGANGTSGSAGASGESVVSAAIAPGEEGCAEGGSRFTVGGKTTTACNGEKGGEGPQGPAGTTGFTKTLPSGETETGTWSLLQEETPEEFHWLVPISFAIPLKVGIEPQNIHFVKRCAILEGSAKTECEKEVKELEKEDCPGTVEDPRAKPGDLCIFQGNTKLPENGTLPVIKSVPPAGFSYAEAGAGPTGTALVVGYKGPANEQVLLVGVWAVTAP